MKKILLSLLLAGGVQNSFAMQAGGAAAQGGAAESTLSAVNRQLIEAAKEGNVAAVRALLESGADVNAQLAEDWTALMRAARAGHVEFVAYGSKALMIAARKGHAEVVRALLAGGADVNSQTANGETALIYAVMYAEQNAHIEVVKVLLDSGADVNAQTANGATALMYAAMSGHVDYTEVIRELLEQSADVNLQNKDGRKAIDYAHGKKKEMILLNAQADKVSSVPKISSSQFASSPASASKAASGSTALASAGGGVTRASGGATKNVDKTLCATVAAKILADAVSQTNYLGSQSAGTQTEPIQVGSNQAAVQKRLIKSLTSAFSKPSLSGKPSSASKMAGNEARTSGGIVVPIARRLGATSFAGLQPNIAPHVAAPPVFSLQRLILTAGTNETGFLGLMQLLNDSAANVYFDAHQADALFIAMGLDTTVFVQASYADITGLQLAEVLRQNIIDLCGHDVYSSNIPRPEQAALMSALNQRFAPYAQTLGN
jgi:hypothetical protein